VFSSHSFHRRITSLQPSAQPPAGPSHVNMQLTLLSVAAAMVATASASSDYGQTRDAVTLNAACDKSAPHARIVNRCDYPVNIWSVYKGLGCPTSQMVTLKTGESYNENYAIAKEDSDTQGVSIKISKSEECKGNDITQLEYFLDDRNSTDPKFRLNYLDVSYVDCLDKDCPGMKEGYYLRVGTKTARAAKLTMDNSWCPIQACHDPVSCALMSYIMPNDVQTKTCDFSSNMEFYLCGSEAPSEDDEAPASSAPASSQKAETPSSKPSSTTEVSSKADGYAVKAAAVVTPAPEVPEVKEPKVKTKVVYVTAYEYINAKRSDHGHAQAHARRHQAFHA
jgi:hypothetical protein